MIAVTWKWVSPAGDGGDPRWAGVSLADQAALECALGLAEPTGEEVVVVSAGSPLSVTGLRRAVAAGADRAVLVELPADAPSRTVATALAGVVGRARVVVCGDLSLDRATGAVPAFLAAELGAAQALGLVELGADGGEPDALVAVRRLDGGRRERLRLPTPAVVSVEGAVARLRRASLPATIAAADVPIEVVRGPSRPVERPVVTIRRYRPRPRVVPGPAGASALDRVRSLLAAGRTSAAGQTLVLEPRAAAARLLTALDDWGYLP
jgi:electron transfer flavoprotein beta subunit